MKRVFTEKNLSEIYFLAVQWCNGSHQTVRALSANYSDKTGLNAKTIEVDLRGFSYLITGGRKGRQTKFVPDWVVNWYKKNITPPKVYVITTENVEDIGDTIYELDVPMNSILWVNDSKLIVTEDVVSEVTVRLHELGIRFKVEDREV